MTKSLEKKTRIIKMLRKWNQDRWNKKKALNLLSSGSFYSITPDDIKVWSAPPIKPKQIHSYIGIENDRVYFILIDSETDKIPLSKMGDIEIDKIIIKRFRNNLNLFTPNFIVKTEDGNVSVAHALSRNLCWQLMKESWVEDQIESVRDMQVGIARVFSSPFSDLEDIHQVNKDNDILAVMGLKSQEKKESNGNVTIFDEKSPYQLDLCFWALENNGKLRTLNFGLPENSSPVEDLTLVCPPYEENNEKFSLIYS